MRFRRRSYSRVKTFRWSLFLAIAVLVAAVAALIVFLCTREESPEEPTEPSALSAEEPTEQTPETDPSESSSEEPSSEEEEPSGEDLHGELKDSGTFSDIDQLPNKSIPYGNNWDDKDASGLPNGIHYYESLYSKYFPYYRIPEKRKVLYLTFDEGYEAGYTPRILDTLKEKNVHAVFFITKQFFDTNPELVERMINEGHIIGNHTCLHPEGGYPKYVDAHGIDTFIDDVSRLHKLVYDRFGYTMTLFRFPEGEASERLMAKLYNLGYRSVFWSYAHYDYNTSNQPEVETTLSRCLTHMAPGAIYLLHAVSASNTEALPDFIDEAKRQGYSFGEFPLE